MDTVSEAVALPVRRKIKHLSRAERKDLQKRSRIDHLLYVVGTESFEEKSVADFMQKKLEAYHNPPPVELRDRGFLPMAVGFTGLLYLALHLSSYIEEWRRDLSGMAGCLALILFGWFINKKLVRLIPVQPRLQAEWKTVPFSTYDDRFDTAKVPVTVRNLVNEIEAREPEAEFRVHYLYKDPFLEIILMEDGIEHRRFIAFWDEHGFVH